MNKLKGLVFLLVLVALTSEGLAQRQTGIDDPFARKWELSVHGGWSYRLAKLSDQVPSDLINYGNKLRSGYHLGADVDFYWMENMGIGLKYSRFGSEGSAENVILIDNTTGQVIGQGDMGDDIVVHFIAPSFNYRYIFPRSKAALQAHYAIGFLSYINHSLLVGQYFTTTAQNFGTSLGAHLTVPLGQRLSFMAGATLLGGSFGEFKIHRSGMIQTIKAEDDNERENVSRIDISAGLRFRL